MIRENFVRYADLKLQIAKLEAEAEELKPSIVAEMPDKPVELTDYGTFSMVSKKIWHYSPEIEDMRNKLKEEEKVAQQTGIGAEYDESSYLMFKPKK